MPSIRTVTQFDFEPSRERCAFLFLDKIGFAAICYSISTRIVFHGGESFFMAGDKMGGVGSGARPGQGLGQKRGPYKARTGHCVLSSVH